ncbi:hypothetical protein N9J52_04735 [Flavobacteriales bacterium]|nr:hypothetical protein [Flavobacteriales bacterium]
MFEAVKRVLLFFSVLILSYAVAEAVYSTLIISGVLQGRKTIWFQESVPGNTVVTFDPVLGYKIGNVQSRYGAVRDDGVVESVGLLHGNNLGFADSKDFYLNPLDTTIKRIAVLGDSFSASQFTKRSWVEVLESEMNKSLSDSIELYNFSIDGGGVANWSSIVENLFVVQGFRFDGLIFAVSSNDLDRKFHWRQEYTYNGKDDLALGYFEEWFPEEIVSDTGDLIDWKKPCIAVLEPSEVDLILEGQHFEIELLPYFLIDCKGLVVNAIQFIEDLFVSQALASPGQNLFDDGQLSLIQKLGRNCNKLGVPILTLAIGTDEDKALSFSKLVGGEYVTPEDFYRWTDTTTINYRILHDGHWNQNGVNFFALYIKEPIAEWFRKAEIIK